MARDSEGDGVERGVTSDASKDRISKAIKQVYDEVASEPLPDKLATLLAKLKNGKSE